MAPEIFEDEEQEVVDEDFGSTLSESEIAVLEADLEQAALEEANQPEPVEVVEPEAVPEDSVVQEEEVVEDSGQNVSSAELSVGVRTPIVPPDAVEQQKQEDEQFESLQRQFRESGLLDALQ